MGGVRTKDPKRIFSQTTDPSIPDRVTTLENNEYEVLYFASINSSSGTITIPTGATILLGQLPSGVDSVVSTIANSQPTGNSPVTSGAVVVIVSSFDASGNYTLSGTPSAYPVALIYLLKIKAVNWANLSTTNIIEYYRNDAVTLTGTETLTNKRVTKRRVVVSQSATPTINTDNTDIASITGQANDITSFTTNLSGTPVAGDMMMIQITDNGTARAITWGASFQSTSGATLPTTTVISTMLRVLFQWNAVASKWDCIGVN